MLYTKVIFIIINQLTKNKLYNWKKKHEKPSSLVLEYFSFLCIVLCRPTFKNPFRNMYFFKNNFHITDGIYTFLEQFKSRVFKMQIF